MGGKLSVILKSWAKQQKFSAADQLTGHKAACIENLVTRCTDEFLDLCQAHIDDVGGFDESGSQRSDAHDIQHNVNTQDTWQRAILNEAMLTTSHIHETHLMIHLMRLCTHNLWHLSYYAAHRCTISVAVSVSVCFVSVRVLVRANADNICLANGYREGSTMN